MKSILLFIIYFFCVFSTACSKETQTINKKEIVLEQLYETIEEADRLIVKESPFQDAKILFESKNLNDLKELQQSLVLEKPKQWFNCMSFGEPTIYLYKGDKELGVILNNGISIRFSLWSSDVPIVDDEKWLSWFDNRLIHSPRKDFEYFGASQVQNQKNFEKWFAAMPQSIKPIWADLLCQFGYVETAPLTKALKDDMPDQSQRILALLEWFGSGLGPWSGFPSYELTTEEMLLEFDTEDLVSVITSTKISRAQTEGAARLFGGWDFSQKRPNDLKAVPDTLKIALWNHVKNTNDKDKLKRAEKVFKPKQESSNT